jgi:hypothetical protein
MKTFEQFIVEYALPQNMMNTLQTTIMPVLKQNGLMVLPVPQRVEAINAIMSMLGVTPEQYKMFSALAKQQSVTSNPFANQSQNMATQMTPVKQ